MSAEEAPVVAEEDAVAPPSEPEPVVKAAPPEGLFAPLKKELARRAESESKDELVSLDLDALDALAAGLVREDVQHIISRPSLPLAFDDISAELNFITLRFLLSFGLRHEKQVLADVHRSLDDVIMFGVINMYISAVPLTAVRLSSLSLSDVASHFELPTMVEVATETEAITMEQAGPLMAFAKQLQDCMASAGRALSSRGYKDFAALLQDATRGESSSERVVKALVGVLPQFFDEEDGVPAAGSGVAEAKEDDEAAGAAAVALPALPFHRKAVLAAADISCRFNGREERFTFADTDSLPAAVGGELIAQLLAAGVLSITDGSAAEGGWSGQLLRQLRVAAADAVQRLVGKLAWPLTAVDASYYFHDRYHADGSACERAELLPLTLAM
eukprot:PLAT14858.2.p1 GENE.PLAT14858.2~~PLAT14858.2.p1  ORF type:complete len:388 (-),score=142.00 PLAT14858.2:30-1193(-)